LIVLRTGDQALSTDWCRETVSFLWSPLINM
jgi:hypothetical protein